MSDFPTIREELERKTSETLHITLARLGRKEIVPEMARSSLQTIWDVSAGLISDELKDLIADAREAISENASAPRRMILVRNKDMAVLDIPEDGHDLPNITMIVAGKQVKKPMVSDPEHTIKELRDKVEAVAQNLFSAGFKEIQ